MLYVSHTHFHEEHIMNVLNIYSRLMQNRKGTRSLGGIFKIFECL